MKEYFIWLTLALGFANHKTDDILRLYENPKQFYLSIHSDNQINNKTVLTLQEINKLKSTKLEDAYLIIKQCENLGIEIITPDLPSYPKKLLNIYDTPCVLYTKGDISNIDDQVTIAMVGTRDITDYAKEASYRLSYDLAQAGAVVVSGLAPGVDSFAHKGALKGNGKTIAVLGCGINVDYPKENLQLKEIISKNGAIISEFPPDTPAYTFNFPIRNRIISGISLGVVVVEAPIKSGSLITANYALEQGKDIFAVPNSIFHPNGDGTLRLIRDGATPVGNAYQILQDYIYTYQNQLDIGKLKNNSIRYTKNLNTTHLKEKSNYSNKQKNINTNNKINKNSQNKLQETNNNKKEVKTINIPENLKIVYNELSQEPIQLDTIVQNLKLPVSSVLSSLTELEIGGYIQSYPGRRFGI